MTTSQEESQNWNPVLSISASSTTSRTRQVTSFEPWHHILFQQLMRTPTGTLVNPKGYQLIKEFLRDLMMYDPSNVELMHAVQLVIKEIWWCTNPDSHSAWERNRPIHSELSCRRLVQTLTAPVVRLTGNQSNARSQSALQGCLKCQLHMRVNLLSKIHRESNNVCSHFHLFGTNDKLYQIQVERKEKMWPISTRPVVSRKTQFEKNEKNLDERHLI